MIVIHDIQHLSCSSICHHRQMNIQVQLRPSHTSCQAMNLPRFWTIPSTQWQCAHSTVPHSQRQLLVAGTIRILFIRAYSSLLLLLQLMMSVSWWSLALERAEQQFKETVGCSSSKASAGKHSKLIAGIVWVIDQCKTCKYMYAYL